MAANQGQNQGLNQDQLNATIPQAPIESWGYEQMMDSLAELRANARAIDHHRHALGLTDDDPLPNYGFSGAMFSPNGSIGIGPHHSASNATNVISRQYIKMAQKAQLVGVENILGGSGRAPTGFCFAGNLYIIRVEDEVFHVPESIIKRAPYWNAKTSERWNPEGNNAFVVEGVKAEDFGLLLEFMMAPHTLSGTEKGLKLPRLFKALTAADYMMMDVELAKIHTTILAYVAYAFYTAKGPNWTVSGLPRHDIDIQVLKDRAQEINSAFVIWKDLPNRAQYVARQWFALHFLFSFPKQQLPTMWRGLDPELHDQLLQETIHMDARSYVDNWDDMCHGTQLAAENQARKLAKMVNGEVAPAAAPAAAETAPVVVVEAAQDNPPDMTVEEEEIAEAEVAQ